MLRTATDFTEVSSKMFEFKPEPRLTGILGGGGESLCRLYIPVQAEEPTFPVFPQGALGVPVDE